MLCINSRVNAVAHCMLQLAKHADTFITHVSQSIWESHLKLTGKERSISTMSNILAYKHMYKHPVSASDFKILSSANSEWDLFIREILLISHLNLVLNANIRSTPLELF
jgi:hypothetical protein